MSRVGPLVILIFAVMAVVNYFTLSDAHAWVVHLKKISLIVEICLLVVLAVLLQALLSSRRGDDSFLTRWIGTPLRNLGRILSGEEEMERPPLSSETVAEPGDEAAARTVRRLRRRMQATGATAISAGKNSAEAERRPAMPIAAIPTDEGGNSP